mmetsp:Transcript_7855/g.26087  ORF Transcript_7855/g.26087 Transcript_7855/m.26087 type:complete len:293 (-) Transcript_7855:597-1475(-)
MAGPGSLLKPPNAYDVAGTPFERGAPNTAPSYKLPEPAGGPATAGGAAARLTHVAEKFSSFYNDLEHEKQLRRDVEHQRRQQIADQVTMLERTVADEMRRRAEADKALEMKVEQDIRALEEAFAVQMREMQAGLKAQVDALSRTFAELHNGLREEREQRRVDVEHLAQNVVAKVEECKAGLDDERVNRLEREAETLKRVGEEMFRLQEKVDNERGQREATTQSLATELQNMSRARGSSDEKFEAHVLSEMSNLKNALLLEREERCTEDEQIVVALNATTAALQDGLRIVNNG